MVNSNRLIITLLSSSILQTTNIAAVVAARSVPDNVRGFYNSVKNNGDCTGQDLLQGGFYDTEDGSTDYGYCQKGVAGQAIYLKGRQTQLVNMDVDCDGDQRNLDSRCQASSDTQAQTTFQSLVQERFGIPDLRADVHPYVVLGNQGNYSPTFDPQSVGVLPLSIVAVICGGGDSNSDRLIYGIWGDTNGDDGKPLVGEASLALATACFGQSVDGNNGHDEKDVLYIAFVGDKAVPGNATNWNASTYEEFESSISSLGDELISALPSSVPPPASNLAS